MDIDDQTFCQDQLKDLMALQAKYTELSKELEAMEMAFARRFGGMANLSNAEFAHRIAFLWNKLDEKLNTKEAFGE